MTELAQVISVAGMTQEQGRDAVTGHLKDCAYAVCRQYLAGSLTADLQTSNDRKSVTVTARIDHRPIRWSDQTAELGEWVFNVLADGRLEVIHKSKAVPTAGFPVPLELGK